MEFKEFVLLNFIYSIYKFKWIFFFLKYINFFKVFDFLGNVFFIICDLSLGLCFWIWVLVLYIKLIFIV